MSCMITKTVKTAAGQHDASRRPQTTQDGNHIALRMRNRNRKTPDLFKRSVTSARQNNYRQESTRRPLSSLLLFASWARGLSIVCLTTQQLTALRPLVSGLECL